MRRAYFYLFPLYFLSFLTPMAKENAFVQNESGDFKMTLQLESENPAIKEYELEFWKEIDNKKSSELPIQKILKPGRNVLVAPTGYHFFRVRAVALLNIRGYWTEFNPIKRYPLEKEISVVPIFEVPKPIPITDLFLKIQNANGKEDLYLSNSNIKISDLSGKNTSVFYRLGESNWEKLNQTGLQIEQDGSYTLDYYAVDQLGNKESPKQISFLRDSSAPQSHLEFSGESFLSSQFHYISGGSTLSLNARDNLSGVERIYYRFGCQLPQMSEWIVYQNQISLRTLAYSNCKEKFYFEYYARDKVGNSESINFKEIHLTNKND